MSNYSNAALSAKRALSDFLEEHTFNGFSVSERRFVAGAESAVFVLNNLWLFRREKMAKIVEINKTNRISLSNLNDIK